MRTAASRPSGSEISEAPRARRSLEIGWDRRDQRERARLAAPLAAGGPVEAERRLLGPGRVQGIARKLLAEPAVDRRQGHARGGAGEPVEMFVQLERPAPVDAGRLERGAAAEKRLVVGLQDRLAGRDGAAPRTATARSVTRATGASAGSPLPRAARRGRAFTQDSSISSSGSESQTMPPPTQRWARPSATAKVRIVSARSRSPFGWMRPSAPIEAPRPTGSSAAM